MRIRFRTTPTAVTFNSMTSNVEYPQGLDTTSTMLMPVKELARQTDPAEIKIHINKIRSAFADFCEENSSRTVEEQEDDTIAVNDIQKLGLQVNSHRLKVS